MSPHDFPDKLASDATQNHLNRCYNHYILASRLILISIVAVVLKNIPAFNRSILFDYLVALPILFAYFISIKGIYHGLKTNKTTQYNSSKRTKALTGQILYAGLITALILSLFYRM